MNQGGAAISRSFQRRSRNDMSPHPPPDDKAARDHAIPITFAPKVKTEIGRIRHRISHLAASSGPRRATRRRIEEALRPGRIESREPETDNELLHRLHGGDGVLLDGDKRQHEAVDAGNRPELRGYTREYLDASRPRSRQIQAFLHQQGVMRSRSGANRRASDARR
jgi:hypothetical protein